MKTLILFLFIGIFSLSIISCGEGNKVGQFKTLDGQPVAVGYDKNLELQAGDRVWLHVYSDGTVALAEPGDTLGIKAVFVK